MQEQMRSVLFLWLKPMLLEQRLLITSPIRGTAQPYNVFLFFLIYIFYACLGCYGVKVKLK